MKLNFKEKYLIFLVVLCFVAVGFYYSYAIFVVKQLQENVVAVKVDNNRVLLTVDGKETKASIKANSEVDLKINLNNTKNTKYYYLVLVKGLISGVKVSSDDNVKDVINEIEKKELTIHVNNTTDKDIELEFMVQISTNEIFDKEIGYSYINKTPNYDHSGANKPEINNLKLLPVSYKEINKTEGYWYRVSEDNQNDLWYSYENGVWANAVLLSESNYNKYKNSSLDTEIELGDILGFYVWIPRFKYYVINNSSYTNYERLTNIVFEEGNNSTGTITCTDQISNSLDKHIYSEICQDNVYHHIYDNLSTYTHPAFKTKNGFWVAKFLMGEGEKVLPNVSILKRNITDANNLSNKYNSHVLTNMEYGAVVLLSNSSYGKTGNVLYHDDDSNVFTRIYANTYEHGVTGCSSEYNSYSKSFITSITNKCVAYNDLTNYSHISNSINYPIGYAGAGASSTGTVYGVYDLANISGELVASFVALEDGSINTELNHYDTYSYSDYIGKVASSSNIHNLYRYKLGDGIREHFRTFSENGMWHGGMLSQNVNSGVIVRGGNGVVNHASVYTTSIEEENYSAPFRLVLSS